MIVSDVEGYHFPDLFYSHLLSTCGGLHSAMKPLTFLDDVKWMGISVFFTPFASFIPRWLSPLYNRNPRSNKWTYWMSILHLRCSFKDFSTLEIILSQRTERNLNLEIFTIVLKLQGKRKHTLPREWQKRLKNKTDPPCKASTVMMKSALTCWSG